MQRFLLLMLFPLLGLSHHAVAQGNLLITPMRIVFEGNKQQAEINIMNTGKDTATYSISFRQYNMTEQGRLELIEKPDQAQMFADPYLRIFPRQVTLAPGEPQVVMLQYRRSANMLPGEYRSHLWFRVEPDYKALDDQKALADSNQLSVKIIPVYGITIPVIIRTGAVTVSATLSNIKLDAQQPKAQNLQLTINRIGNISLYGDIVVEYLPAQGKPVQIGTVAGVGVYTNINKRDVTIKLNSAPGNKLSNGKLRVQYLSNGEPKRVVYAEQELTLM